MFSRIGWLGVRQEMMLCGSCGMNRMISVATPTSITGITFLYINVSKLMCIIVYGFTYMNDPEFSFSTEI